MRVRHLSSLLFVIAVLCASAQAQDDESQECMYTSASGMITMVKGEENVPEEFRSSMRCMTAPKHGAGSSQYQQRSDPRSGSNRSNPMQARSQRLASPDEVTLDGNIRREQISTPLGTAELRWPRSVETIFGRTPLRATADAAKTVSKMLRSASFPSHMQNLNLPWRIVFMDENLSEDEIPSRLISNCHPGWMTPPANIYIVAQRVAAGCSSQSVSTSVADSQLAEVLVHEMAHAVEFYMLAQSNYPDRMRAEGFATWFETYAAQYSSFLSRRSLQQRNARAAAYAIQHSGGRFNFSGSAYDYSRASLYFSAVEEQFGLRGVIRVYERIVADRIPLFQAIEKEFTWNQERLNKEVLKVIEKHK